MPQQNKQRLYRIWLSFREANSRREAEYNVVATEAMRAIEAVLRKHHDSDVVVATIEQVASLDDALRDEDVT